MDERLLREKTYHNTAFSEGIRKSADKYYTIHNLSYARLAAKLRQYGSGKDILEYGCGPGSHSFVLATYARKVTAIDISDYAINNAAQKAKDEGINNIAFIEMDAENLQFPDDSFDLVYGNAIIHHLDLIKAFAEINRVLRPGGRAFFYEPLGHNVFINLYRKLTPRMRTIDEHPLLAADLKLARRSFSNVSISYFHLTTLFAVPFRGMKGYNRILAFLHRMDNAIFSICPFMRRQAWYCIIELKKN